jgi:peptide-methionine (S)-S-oxide reductase
MKKEKLAYFAGGCFWCTEAVFQNLHGVDRIISGYMGGSIKNPAYREICTGRTGHAEGIQLTYDENVLSYKDLLYVFFATHDPTTLNRQGNDVGTQYRSAIFYVDEHQEAIAKEVITELQQTTFEAPIVTQLLPEHPFYNAEEEHQNYYNQHTEQLYCSYVISPKVAKLKEKFNHLLH